MKREPRERKDKVIDGEIDRERDISIRMMERR